MNANGPTCPQCGVENPAAANYCRRCGAARAERMLRSATPISVLLRQWRQLRNTLTRKEVRKLLGEPLRVEIVEPPDGAAREDWTYEYVPAESAEPTAARLCGVVRFLIAEGRLISWTEPDWAGFA